MRAGAPPDGQRIGMSNPTLAPRSSTNTVAAATVTGETP